MSDDLEPATPAGLHAPKPTEPLEDITIEVLAQLLAVGREGMGGVAIRENLNISADVERTSTSELCHRRLAHPQAMPSHYVVALSWVTYEARLMFEAAPGALDDWSPSWWPVATLDSLTEVLAPAVGADLAPWVTLAIAGLQLDDGKDWYPAHQRE